MDETTFQPGQEVQTLTGKSGTVVEVRGDGRVLVQHDGERRSYQPFVLVDPEADVEELLEAEDYPDSQAEEGPSCSICDALGHGYPGGGPCPLESPDPGYYADELAAGR